MKLICSGLLLMLSWSEEINRFSYKPTRTPLFLLLRCHGSLYFWAPKICLTFEHSPEECCSEILIYLNAWISLWIVQSSIVSVEAVPIVPLLLCLALARALSRPPRLCYASKGTANCWKEERLLVGLSVFAHASMSMHRSSSS